MRSISFDLVIRNKSFYESRTESQRDPPSEQPTPATALGFAKPTIISDRHDPAVTSDAIAHANFRLWNCPFGHPDHALISAGSLPDCVLSLPCPWARVKGYNIAQEIEEAP